ncbi:hypothetical protein AGLY_016436 [Aphis glycines]|uniref:DUF4371 domain-containing protein n=1 Tax=Aphis glycines TaxID=307491 RepID=A0A6G0SXV7_APHGL|nr:hypothetical protein AGLY_016436 [Aphis glycines]
MDKRSNDANGNTHPVKIKRSSGWARKKETDRQKLKAIAQDKNQQKLNFGFVSSSSRPSNESTQNAVVNMQPSIYEPSCSNPSGSSIPLSIEFDERNIVDLVNNIVPNDPLHEIAQSSDSDLVDNSPVNNNNFTALSHNSTLAEKLQSIFVQGVQVCTKNINKQIKIHENSKTHDEAVYAYMQAKKVKDVSSLIDINQRNFRVTLIQESRLFLSRIIEGILYIGRQGIVYRAHKGEQAYTLENKNMNHGNFLELLMCWSKFDPLLEKYLNIVIKKSKNRSTLSRGRGSLVTFFSKATINKIINLISQWIQKKKLEKNLFIDSIQDVSVTEQLAVCVRYVIQTDVKERLIKFLPAIDFYNLIKNVFEDIGLSFSNIVSQAYDGGANLSGIHNGLQALIKNDAPQSIYTHCQSHLLNLTLTQASDSCSQAINLFGLLDRLAIFFSQSYKRMGMRKQTVIENSDGNEKLLRLQKIGQIRWWSRDVALNNVFDPLFTPNKEKHRFITVIKALLAVANSDDFDLGVKSEALRFKLLHNSKAKLIEGVHNFEHIFIKTTEFTEYLKTILENMNGGTDNIFWSSSFQKKKEGKMPSELTADERLVDEKKLFEVEVYKVVYNNALTKLNNRYMINEDLIQDAAFFDPRT